MGIARRNNFDGLRLIGALLVLFSHQFAVSGKWEPRLVGDHSFGNLGVLIFFSISGYLISASWAADPRPGIFLLKRILRMLPGVAVAVVLAFLVLAPFGLVNFPGNPRHLFNAPLWTLPMEFACYALALVFGVLSPRPARWVLVATLLCLCTQLAQSFAYFVGYFGLFFAVGALLFEYPTLRAVRWTMTGLALGALLCFEGWTIAGLALMVPPIVVAVGNASWTGLRNAAGFGDLSYGIYIYAWPVQQLFVHLLGADAGYATLVIPALAVTLPAAFASWHLIEKRALALKNRIASRPFVEHASCR